MNDKNLFIFNELLTILNNSISFHIFEGFIFYYNKCKDKSNNKNILKNFQLSLEQITYWNQNIINDEVIRMLSKSKYNVDINNLLQSCIKSYINCFISNYSSNISINFNDFIHNCYIECARNFYLNPLLFYHNLNDTEIKKNQLEILTIINDSIKNVIRYKIDYNDIINNINFNNNIDLVKNNNNKNSNKNIIYDNKNNKKNDDIVNIKNKNDNHSIINIKNNDNNDLFNIKSNKIIDNKFIKSINYKNKLNTFNKKDETSIYEPFLNNVLDEYDNCK